MLVLPLLVLPFLSPPLSALVLLPWLLITAGAGADGRELPKNPRIPVDAEDEGGGKNTVLLPLPPAVTGAGNDDATGRRAMMTLKKCVGTWMSRGNVPTAFVAKPEGGKGDKSSDKGAKVDQKERIGDDNTNRSNTVRTCTE